MKGKLTNHMKNGPSSNKHQIASQTHTKTKTIMQWISFISKIIQVKYITSIDVVCIMFSLRSFAVVQEEFQFVNRNVT